MLKVYNERVFGCVPAWESVDWHHMQYCASEPFFGHVSHFLTYSIASKAIKDFMQHPQISPKRHKYSISGIATKDTV